MQLLAELKSTKQTKSVSGDNVFTLTFVTDNSEVMDLGKMPPDTLFKLNIGIEK